MFFYLTRHVGGPFQSRDIHPTITSCSQLEIEKGIFPGDGVPKAKTMGLRLTIPDYASILFIRFILSLLERLELKRCVEKTLW